MYSDSNRRASVRRANDEFLKRMLGGELVESALPTMYAEPSVLRETRGADRVSCDGSVVDGVSKTERMDIGDRCDLQNCPNHIHAPSLAMVYAPRQCWRDLLDPHTGLHQGTIFTELIMPFEGDRKKERLEGTRRK